MIGFLLLVTLSNILGLFNYTFSCNKGVLCSVALMYVHMRYVFRIGDSIASVYALSLANKMQKMSIYAWTFLLFL